MQYTQHVSPVKHWTMKSDIIIIIIIIIIRYMKLMYMTPYKYLL
jgi:hypothetical protein